MEKIAVGGCCLQTCNLDVNNGVSTTFVIFTTDILLYAKYIIMYYKCSFVVVCT